MKSFIGVIKNGKKLVASAFNVCFEFETMSEAGWVEITSVGMENLYFNFKCDEGKTWIGFCKCL